MDSTEPQPLIQGTHEQKIFILPPFIPTLPSDTLFPLSWKQPLRQQCIQRSLKCYKITKRAERSIHALHLEIHHSTPRNKRQFCSKIIGILTSLPTRSRPGLDLEKRRRIYERLKSKNEAHKSCNNKKRSQGALTLLYSLEQ